MSLHDYTSDPTPFISGRLREEFEIQRIQQDLTATHEARLLEMRAQEKAAVPVTLALDIMKKHGLLDYQVSRENNNLNIDIALKQEQPNTREGFVYGEREHLFSGAKGRNDVDYRFDTVNTLLDRIEASSLGAEVEAVTSARDEINSSPLFSHHNMMKDQKDITILGVNLGIR